jgi:WD40 repeat protein
MWDLATETLDYKVNIGTDSRNSPFSPDGSMIITGAETGASIRDTATGETLINLPLQAYGPLGFNFSPDGERMLSANARLVTVWDLTPGHEVRTLTTARPQDRTGKGLSPDGAHLVSMDFTGEVFTRDALTGELLWQAKGHDTVTLAIDFSPDGRHLATGSDDGTIVIWNLDTGEQLLKWQAQDNWVNKLRYSPDGSFLVSANEDGTVKVFDTVDGSLKQTAVTIERGVWGMDIDASGERVAVSTWEPPSMVTVWDVDSGEEIFELAGPETGTGFINLVFDPENRWLAASDKSGFVNIWELESGELLHSIQTHHIFSLPFIDVSPDGNRIASAGLEGMAQIWDPLTGQLLLDIPLIDSGIPSKVGFSPDGRQLWVGGEHDVFFTLDPEELISIAEDRLIRGWTVEECKQYNIDPCPVE